MAEKYSFERVSTLVVSPEANTRESVRTLLHNAGFREIRLGNTLEDIRVACKLQPPDLLLCEAEFPDGDAAALINALRHHKEGANPFLPVIMLTWEPTPEVVRKVVDCGADDLLVKPLSVAQINDRVMALIRARKPFVVTTDYIGPDRRKAARTDEDHPIPQIEVPNVLAAKASGVRDLASIQHAIDECMGKVNLQKLERHAVQIGWLIEHIVPGLIESRGKADPRIRKMLERLLYVAEDASRRLAGTKYAPVSELCHTLITVTSGIVDAADGPLNPKDVQLLTPLAKAIEKAFNVTEEVADLARKISSSVDASRRKQSAAN